MQAAFTADISMIVCDWLLDQIPEFQVRPQLSLHDENLCLVIIILDNARANIEAVRALYSTASTN
jgi:hypothetical protein